ncbi:PEPxxWA-CTERM sorting domain-containing protein [Phenylobacterium sp.]|uniref:PEPxxWA-CTERM sorting domain-containing protein n=1 Tax=Phenylobacterium sp. TaxID=1871053 RepID=UPI0025ECD3BC|nr:PEPxxWA-CTERM sorting domain-containing protein [Phenylobacterium sp.]
MRKSSRATKRALFALLVATIAVPLPAMTPALLSSAIGAMALVAAPSAAPELTPMVPVYFKPARHRPAKHLTPESELARLAEPRQALFENIGEPPSPPEDLKLTALYDIQPRLPTPWDWLIAPDGPVTTGIPRLPRVTTAVPEPSTWAMLITGFGLAGAYVRRRRRAAGTAGFGVALI